MVARIDFRVGVGWIDRAVTMVLQRGDAMAGPGRVECVTAKADHVETVCAGDLA